MKIRSKNNPGVLISEVEGAIGGYLSPLANDYRIFYPNTLWDEVKEERWEPVPVTIYAGRVVEVLQHQVAFVSDIRAAFINPNDPSAGIRFERRVS